MIHGCYANRRDMFGLEEGGGRDGWLRFDALGGGWYAVDCCCAPAMRKEHAVRFAMKILEICGEIPPWPKDYVMVPRRKGR